jgi:hypothetical protein
MILLTFSKNEAKRSKSSAMRASACAAGCAGRGRRAWRARPMQQDTAAAAIEVVQSFDGRARHGVAKFRFIRLSDIAPTLPRILKNGNICLSIS